MFENLNKIVHQVLTILRRRNVNQQIKRKLILNFIRDWNHTIGILIQ